MTRLLIVLSFAALGFAAAPARACDEYCEEYVEHLEDRAEERASAREEAAEEGEVYVARRRGMQRRAMPSAPKVSAAKRSRTDSGTDDDDGDEPKTSETSSSKSEVATAGGCKQYFPAVGMALSVPCK